MIEIMRAMRGFAKKNNSRVADQLHERVVVLPRIRDRMSVRSQRADLQFETWVHGLPLQTQTSRRPGGGAFREQIADFFVTGLGKISVPLADSPKGLGRESTDHLIRFRFELRAGSG